MSNYWIQVRPHILLVGPNLGPNFLHWLPADNNGRYRVISSHVGYFFVLLLSSADFFQNILRTLRGSNSLEPDQDRHSGSKLFAKVISSGHWQVWS